MSWCLLDCLEYSDDAVSYRLEKEYSNEIYNQTLEWRGKCLYGGYSMNAINSVNFEGFISLDPVTNFFNNGNGVVHLSVGIPSYYKKDDELKQSISFVPVDFFFDASGAIPTFEKGNEIHVTGRLKQDRWKTGEDEWRSKLKIVAQSITPR